MLTRHANIAVDIPAGWRDESTILFVAPPAASTLPTTASVTAPGEAVALRFALARGRTADALLSEQVDLARAADAELVTGESAAFNCQLGHGRLVELQMKIANQTIIQLLACVVTGPLAVMATASTGSIGFSAARPRLLAILESLQVSP